MKNFILKNIATVEVPNKAGAYKSYVYGKIKGDDMEICLEHLVESYTKKSAETECFNDLTRINTIDVVNVKSQYGYYGMEDNDIRKHPYNEFQILLQYACPKTGLYDLFLTPQYFNNKKDFSTWREGEFFKHKFGIKND